MRYANANANVNVNVNVKFRDGRECTVSSRILRFNTQCYFIMPVKIENKSLITVSHGLEQCTQ